MSTGHEPSGDEFTALLGVPGVNTSGDQLVTNSTTLVDATGLSVNLVTGNWYEIEGTLFYSVPTGNNMKVSSAGTATIGYIIWTMQSVPNGGTQGQWYSGTFTSASAAFVAGGNGNIIRMHGVIQCTGSGTFKIQFAENTAGAGTSATMQKGSWINAVVIA